MKTSTFSFCYLEGRLVGRAQTEVYATRESQNLTSNAAELRLRPSSSEQHSDNCEVIPMGFGKVSNTRRRVSSVVCSIALLTTLVASYPVSLVRATNEQQQAKPAAQKRPLTHKDYDSWRSIQASQISRDGKFVAYAYVPQDGDGEIVVRTVGSNLEWHAPRGYRPPVPPPDDPGANIAEIVAGQARLLRPVFTADNKFVVFGTEPTKAELNKAKRDKKRPEEMPKNGMGIMDVTTGAVVKIERVKSFQVPEDGAGYIAYLMEAPAPERPAPVSYTHLTLPTNREV